MDVLKKIFPLSWKMVNSVGSFVAGIIIYILLTAIFSLAATLAGILVGWIPVIGKILIWALSVIGSVLGVYSLVGLILLILVYCKVIKD